MVSPDAGVVGPDAQIPDDAGTAASISSSASRLLPSRDLSALWWVLALVLVFASTRIGSRVVKARAAEGSRVGSVASRLWPLLETGVWILASLAAVGFAFGVQKHLLLYTLLACVAVAGAVQFNALRDVAAGLIFAAERPFDVGDVVRVAGIEGQVRGLRLRFLELDTSDGRRVQIPYREVVGTTDVRSGGARVANAVRLDLDLPATVDPTRALDAARELAASSPWAVLAAPPRVQLESRGEGRNVIAVEGYAFDAEVQSALHADLLSGWRDVLRGLSEG